MTDENEFVGDSTHTAKEWHDLVRKLMDSLRKLIHVHSVAYYHLDKHLVSDAEWDSWSNDLIQLQADFPGMVNDGYLPEYFTDWTGDTGMHLPFTEDILECIYENYKVD